MNTSDMTIEKILYEAGLRINNSMTDNQVSDAVSPMGYNSEKFAEAVALLRQSVTLFEDQKKEYGEQSEAQFRYETERKQAHANYMNSLQIARIAFKKDVKAITTLELTGRRASTISGWLKQTQGFYRAILANAGWKAAMAVYGQTEEVLNAQLSAVEAVAAAAVLVQKEKGDAQNATQKRDGKIEELVEWVNDYEVIARIALADKPQLLEKLGIVIKG